MIKRILSLFLLVPATFLAVDNIDWNQKLLNSTENGNLAEVENALKNGANTETKDANGDTALHKASFYGYENIANMLLKNGANIDAKNSCGFTVLHYVSCGGHENVANLLLEYGADIDAKNNLNCTALQYAFLKNNRNIEKLLVLFSHLKKTSSTNIWNIVFRQGYSTMTLLSYYNNIPKLKDILLEIDKINSTKSALGFILNTNLFNKSPDKIKALVKLYKKLYLLRFQYEFDKNLDNINKEFENIINDKPNNISTNIKALGLKNYYKEVLAKILAGYMLKEIHNLPSELIFKITQEF